MQQGQTRRPPETPSDDTNDTDDTGQGDTDQVQPQPFTVGVIADLNSSYGSTTYTDNVHDALSRIVDLSPDLVLSAGDMVAGQKAELDYEAMWEAFHDAVSTPLESAGIPFAITPGNHDASAYSGYEGERSIYQSQWLARRPELDFVDEEDYPFNYSFNFSGTLFVSLDATKVGKLGQEQMSWLEQQVSADYQHKIIFTGTVDWGRLAALIARSAYTKHVSMESIIQYTGIEDHAEFLRQAFDAGTRFAEMIDVQRQSATNG